MACGHLYDAESRRKEKRMMESDGDRRLKGEVCHLGEVSNRTPAKREIS
jgi:hypothetical protein